MKKKNVNNTGKNKNNEVKKKIVTFIVIGVILFSMIFSCFSYLIYALESV